MAVAEEFLSHYQLEVDDRPILLGRLSNSGNRHRLVGHLGDVHALSPEEYRVLQLMDGHNSLDAIGERGSIEVRSVREIFCKFWGEKRLTTLRAWCQLRWCGSCRVYLNSSMQCVQCGGDLEPVILSPPCDPWVLFPAERQFVCERLTSLGVTIPNTVILLGNNGLHNGVFFWEIILNGRKIARISFNGRDESTWFAELLVAPDEIDFADEEGGDSKAALLKYSIANCSRLACLEADAIAFLEEISSIYDVPLLLYFSGGKESIVLLKLLERARIKANLAFVATGADVPEDANFMIEVLKPWLERHPLFNLEVNFGTEDVFLRTLTEHGKLTAAAPWCRKNIKAPLKEAITQKLYGSNSFVAIEGSRWYENDFRRSHPRLNWISDYKNQIWAHPIASWTGLDVWTYITANRLPLNPLYEMGFQRTTCWLCPIVNPFHFELSKKRYPSLWQRVDERSLVGFEKRDNFGVPF
jgi:3'-phosphoadenosine 5'-phosphosulfate sulfotransferase (PAPS reductase)/FAD synthetase